AAFTLQVTNLGLDAASAVRFGFTSHVPSGIGSILFAGLPFASSPDAGVVCSHPFICVAGSVAAGGSVTMTGLVGFGLSSATVAGQDTMYFSAVADQFDPVLANNTTQVTSVVRANNA